MPTITQKEYTNLVRRQERVEAEIGVLKKIVRDEITGSEIKPVVLRKWERISRDLDRGKGRSFASGKAAQKWLKSI